MTTNQDEKVEALKQEIITFIEEKETEGITAYQYLALMGEIADYIAEAINVTENELNFHNEEATP